MLSLVMFHTADPQNHIDDRKDSKAVVLNRLLIGMKIYMRATCAMNSASLERNDTRVVGKEVYNCC